MAQPYSVVKDVCEITTKLNEDFENINKWAHQWKMYFNPDQAKMEKKVLFSRKKSKVNHPNLIFIEKHVHAS